MIYDQRCGKPGLAGTLNSGRVTTRQRRPHLFCYTTVTSAQAVTA